jgi:hypothetical protein
MLPSPNKTYFEVSKNTKKKHVHLPNLCALVKFWEKYTFYGQCRKEKIYLPKALFLAEIQFGSHVHMLPMSKNYISECQKIQTKNFTCTSS